MNPLRAAGFTGTGDGTRASLSGMSVLRFLKAPSDNQVTTSRIYSAFWTLLAIPAERVCKYLDPTGLG